MTLYAKRVMVSAALAICTVAVVGLAQVTIPHSFTAGTTAKATEVNANFAALKAAVDASQTQIAELQAQVAALKGAGPRMPEDEFRAGSYADLARGLRPTITAGSLAGFGPTGEYAEESMWQTNTFPSSMTLDLGALRHTIFRISFQTYWPSDTRWLPAYEGTGAYVLSYSEDNTKWTQVPAVAPVQRDLFTHSLANIAARYVRLTVVAPYVAGASVNIGTFKVYSYTAGDSTAIDARRLYSSGSPLRLVSADGQVTQIGVGYIGGSNGAGNLHIDADQAKTDGRVYLNWLNGRGVRFGDGANHVVAEVDSTGRVSASALSINGTPVVGLVGGGTCLSGVNNVWEPKVYLYGDAKCSTPCTGYGTGVCELVCPAGTVKWITSRLVNGTGGGEGGVCVR